MRKVVKLIMTGRLIGIFAENNEWLNTFRPNRRDALVAYLLANNMVPDKKSYEVFPWLSDHPF